jgi:FkbM family methyltransferase
MQRYRQQHTPMRRLLSELAYRGEVLCSRLQGIAYQQPERNGEHLLVRRLAPGIRHAIDIGANVGDWTAAVLRATHDRAGVTCLEPDPRNAVILRSRFDGQTGVRVLEAAVSDRTGEVTFVPGEGAGNGLGFLSRESKSAMAVRTIPLEAVVADLGDPEIDLVKCDVEGEEMAILAGASQLFRRSRIGVMQVEYNGTWLRAGRSMRELFAFAGDHRYRLLLATPLGFAHLPSYGLGLEDYRMRNIVLAREDRVSWLAAFGPAGRARVEHARADP